MIAAVNGETNYNASTKPNVPENEDAIIVFIAASSAFSFDSAKRLPLALNESQPTYKKKCPINAIVSDDMGGA